MKHLRVAYTPEDIKKINNANSANKRSTRVVLSPKMEQGSAACLAVLDPCDELVDAAMSAECDACRIAVGVAKTGDKPWEGKASFGAKSVPQWEEQPMAGAEDLIASAMKNRG